MNSQVKIGKKLKEARKKLGLKQSEVAEKAGVNSNYYARLERDEVTASLDTFKKILKALKLKSSNILPF